MLLVSYVPARGKPFLEEDRAVIARFQRTEETVPENSESVNTDCCIEATNALAQ
jgi:hypothetical protein